MQSQLAALRFDHDPFAFTYPDNPRVYTADDGDDDDAHIDIGDHTRFPVLSALDIPKHPSQQHPPVQLGVHGGGLGFYHNRYVHPSPDDADALDAFDPDLISPASDVFPSAHMQAATSIQPSSAGLDSSFGPLYNLDDVSSFGDGRPSSSSSSALSSGYSPPYTYSYPPVPPFPSSTSASSSAPHHSAETDSQEQQHGGTSRGDISNRTYAFVALPGNAVRKRPRRRYDEIERLYSCCWPGCTKAYGTLNHLNAHVNMQKHGEKRHPSEFKELRKHWRRVKKEQQEQESAARHAAAHHHHQQQHMRRRATDPGIGASSLFAINPALTGSMSYSGAHGQSRHGMGMGYGIGEEDTFGSSVGGMYAQDDGMRQSLLYSDEEPMMRRSSETDRQPQIGYGHHHYADMNAYLPAGAEVELLRRSAGFPSRLPSSTPTPMHSVGSHQQLHSLPPLSALSESLATSGSNSLSLSSLSGNGSGLSSLNMSNLQVNTGVANMGGMGIPSPASISSISPISPVEVGMGGGGQSAPSFYGLSHYMASSSNNAQSHHMLSHHGHALHHSQSHPQLHSQSISMGPPPASPTRMHRVSPDSMLLASLSATGRSLGDSSSGSLTERGE